jgi:hypothetical protein
LTLKGYAMTQGSIQAFIGRLKRPGGPLSNPTVDEILVRPLNTIPYGIYTFTLKVTMEGVK